MQLTETIKLYPGHHLRSLIMRAMHLYCDTVNNLVTAAAAGEDISSYSSKTVNAELPSAVKNQCIRDARSIVRKYYKTCHQAVLQNRASAKRGKNPWAKAPKLPVLRRPVYYVNNQNFKLYENRIDVPFVENEKCKRFSIKIKMTDRQKQILSDVKCGTMRIVLKNHKLLAQITYEYTEAALRSDGSVMGVDLGIKCPAVSYCSDGSVKFYGNGRKNRYMRRHFRYLRKRLQKKKKMKAVRRIGNKEQRVMRDIDHKISHDIVSEAIRRNVRVIKLEQLQNVRQATRTSRKNNSSLHSWSFYRLAQYIEYKARRAGIKVVYVNPSYTSQRCPICGKHNHASDRTYVCECGFHGHRDIVGAYNICCSTEYVGDKHIRRAA